MYCLVLCGKPVFELFICVQGACKAQTDLLSSAFKGGKICFFQRLSVTDVCVEYAEWRTLNFLLVVCQLFGQARMLCRCSIFQSRSDEDCLVRPGCYAGAASSSPWQVWWRLFGQARMPCRCSIFQPRSDEGCVEIQEVFRWCPSTPWRNQKIYLAIGFGDDDCVSQQRDGRKVSPWRVMDVITGTVSPLAMITGGECGFLTKPICIFRVIWFLEAFPCWYCSRCRRGR